MGAWPHQLIGDVMSKDKPWFAANSSGPGFHPVTWQGWLVLIGIIAVIVVVVLVVRGVL